jgi:hypothetical protein
MPVTLPKRTNPFHGAKGPLAPEQVTLLPIPDALETHTKPKRFYKPAGGDEPAEPPKRKGRPRIIPPVPVG